MHEAPFGNILEGYASVRQQCATGLRSKSRKDSDPYLCEAYRRYTGAWNQWAETQKGSADDFNLFRVLEVAYDELRHSMLLAWLLDRRIEYGTHAQGSLGLELFLKEVGLDAGYAAHAYWVRREVSVSVRDYHLPAACRGGISGCSVEQGRCTVAVHLHSGVGSRGLWRQVQGTHRSGGRGRRGLRGTVQAGFRCRVSADKREFRRTPSIIGRND